MSRSMNRLSAPEVERLQRRIDLFLTQNGFAPSRVLAKLKSKPITAARTAAIEWLQSTIGISCGRWFEATGEIPPVARLSQPEIGWLLNIDHSTVNVILKRLAKRQNEIALANDIEAATIKA